MSEENNMAKSNQEQAAQQQKGIPEPAVSGAQVVGNVAVQASAQGANGQGQFSAGQANMQASAPQGALRAVPKQETVYTKRMKENFGFFGPITFLYACLYAFCMFHNGSGVTFPFFMAGSLLFLHFSLSKLEISWKKGSVFYMAGMMLLAVSTFCTDDWRIIAFNKTGIFLLMMSLLLKQFFDTSNWKLGKYLGAICELVVVSIGELGRPFQDAARYMKDHKSRNMGKVWYAVLGLVIAMPLFLTVLLLLSSADAVFRSMTRSFLEGIRFGNVFNVVFRVGFLFFASYLLTAYLCKKSIKEEVTDHRKGEPILAITVTGMLTLLYLVFSGIQIVYLFMGQMQLPEGYTYAEYAREGFFQLLAVGILNLIIVLIALSFFRESKALKIVLTVMSLCTFVMIASSAMRMLIYISYYYLTFLRILVLWGLSVLFLLFAGVIVSIFWERFRLFQYSMVVVTVMYTALSFLHPDYIIARVNVANAPRETEAFSGSEGDFFQSGEPYHDYEYLCSLSADAAPVLIPYLAEIGYDVQVFYEEDIWKQYSAVSNTGRNRLSSFGYYYLEKLQESTDNFSLRTFNVSRYFALKQVDALEKTGQEFSFFKQLTFVNETDFRIGRIDYKIFLRDGERDRYLGIEHVKADSTPSAGNVMPDFLGDTTVCSLERYYLLESEIPGLSITWEIEAYDEWGELHNLSFEKIKIEENGEYTDTFVLRYGKDGKAELAPVPLGQS